MKNAGFRSWLEASRWKDSNWKKPPDNVVERLKKYNRPGYYCHFTDTGDKLGINPNGAWEGFFDQSTPYGIYAYTVQYALSHGIKRLPYGTSMDYIWVFRAKNPKKIRKIRYKFDKNAKIFDQIMGDSGSLSRASINFLKRGIEGFIDYDTGTIHPSEPHQAVFFGSQTIIPVDIFNNTLWEY